MEKLVSQQNARAPKDKGLAAPGRTWSSPAGLVPAKGKAVSDGTSSVKTLKEDWRRRQLLAKDFIKDRADNELLEAAGLGDAGLYNLSLMHGQTARRKASRKRPLIKAPNTTPMGTSPPATPSRGAGQSNSAITKEAKEIQELCAILKQDAIDTMRRMENQDSSQSRTRRREGTIFGNSPQNTITGEVMRRAVEAKFKGEIPEDMPNSEELACIFGTIVYELLDKFGTLGHAMQALDRGSRGRLNQKEWERNVDRATSNKVEPDDLSRIFKILDQDNDGELSFEDVLRFDPVTTMLTRDAPEDKEELVLFEFDKQKAHAQLIRQRKAAVCHNLFFSTKDRRNITASLQEMERRKAEKGKPGKDNLNPLKELAKKYREKNSKSNLTDDSSDEDLDQEYEGRYQELQRSTSEQAIKRNSSLGSVRRESSLRIS